jgi:hypothetical protein
VSREVRRVPLDFNFPIGETWSGYLMPDELHLPKCAECGGDGYSREARAVAHTFYPHQIVHAGAWHGASEHAESLAWHDKLGQAEVDMLVAKGRLSECVRREPTEDNPRNWEWVSVPRTAAEVNEVNRRGGRENMLGLHSHDGINRMYLIEFRCERLGIPVCCRTCDGSCQAGTPEQRAATEAWESTDPPTGDGWQLWQTVSEGGPVTPVFASADGLIGYLCTHLDFNPGAARTLIEQGSTVGSFVGIGGSLLDSATDADVIAAVGDPDQILTEDDMAAAVAEFSLEEGR